MGRAVERAHELAEELGDAVVPQQFENSLNVEAHDWEVRVTDGESGGARFEFVVQPDVDGDRPDGDGR